MKKQGKLIGVLLASALILSILPPVSARAAVGAGEIAFTLTPNATITVYSFTDVDVGASSAGYSSINMSFPAELQLNYNGAALSSSNKPANWTITISTGAGATTNVSIMIASPGAYGMEANIESFLNASSFTLKTENVYPPVESSVTVMITEQVVVQFLDINGITHVYEFVEFAKQADKSVLSWLQAYNAARGRTFFGEQGYLATLTSIEEQMFVYNTIAQKPGWLGGTRLRYNSPGNPMIDGTTNISTSMSDYTSNTGIANAWYWANGPEAETVFYNRPTRDDTNGPVPGVFNFFSNRWTYNTYPAYQSQIQNGNEPNGDGGECCLQFAWSNKASWNDLQNNSSIPQGYYVEYDYPEGILSSTGVATAEFLVPVTVSFDIGNSAYANDIANQVIWVSDTATQPPTFKIGYLYRAYGNKRFLGWFEDLSDTTPFDFSTPLTGANTINSAKTLYGKWEQYYDVSFDINNTSFIGAILTQFVVSGGYPTAPLGLTIGTVYRFWNGQQFDNKEFLGWFRPGENPSSDTPYNFSTDAVTKDIALHAEWKQYFDVTFNVDNPAYVGAPPNDTQSVPDGSMATAPSELAEGTLYSAYGNKMFLGWYDGATKFDFSTPISDDTTLTARWEQYYTVTFTNTKDHVVPAQAIAAGNMASVPDSSLWSDMSFTFYGWSTDSTEDYTAFTPFDFSAPVNADIVLFGIWDPIIYSLVYNPNGGSWSGDITPRSHEYCPGAGYPPWEDYDPTHTPGAPSRPGYRFDGWLDASNNPLPGAGTAIFGNNTYLAKWTPEIYRIDYEPNGGMLATGNPATYTVESSVFPIDISDPNRKGYTFLGWLVEYDNPSLPSVGDPVAGFSILQGVTGDIRLVARWNGGDEYAIHYDLDGGAGTLENPDHYTVEDAFSLIAPVKHGYAFLGWTVTGGLTASVPNPTLSIPLGTTGDLYLTAHWSVPIEYDIVYDLDGGTNSAENPTSYTVNDMFLLAAPTREGYTFLGWTVTGGLTMVVPTMGLSVSEGTTGDLSIAAHWQKIPEDEGPLPEELPQTGNIGSLISVFFLLGLFLTGIVTTCFTVRKMYWR